MAKKKAGITLTSPLSKEEHLPLLNTVIDACQVTGEACEKCNNCRIDVDNDKMQNDDIRTIAELIKAAYFPEST